MRDICGKRNSAIWNRVTAAVKRVEEDMSCTERQSNGRITAACDVVAATEKTDHTVENKPMTAIWSQGQRRGDMPGLGYFYRPDEIKFHSRKNRGKVNINFHGQSQCMLIIYYGNRRISFSSFLSLSSAMVPVCE